MIPHIPLEKLRVLCIEDNPSDRLLLREYLMDAELEPEIEFSEACSLAEGQNLMLRGKFDDNPFDIVFLDLSLPDASGRQGFKLLRETDSNTPIVILSGNLDRELALSLVREGAQDFFIKESISPEFIGRAVLYAIERHRANVELKRLNRELHITSENLRTTQAQLLQIEKIDSLNRIASGFAHEIRNPLAVIQGGVSVLHLNLALTKAKDETLSNVLDDMQTAIDRSDNVLKNLISYSQKEQISFQKGSLNECIQIGIQPVKDLLVRQKIWLSFEYSNALLDVAIDVTRMSRVIMNLAENAADAMPNGGTFAIRTFLHKIPSNDPRISGRRLGEAEEPSSIMVEMVGVEFVDSGTGISAGSIDRVMEPFFSTKEVSRSAGLGLALANRIVQLHKGHLSITNNEEGSGVTVRILLPGIPVNRPLSRETASVEETSHTVSLSR